MDVTGKEELAMLSFDWNIAKPGLILTFTTFCCASGTCDNYSMQSEKRPEDWQKINPSYDKNNPFELKRVLGSIR
jgi:hypothetical protein